MSMNISDTVDLRDQPTTRLDSGGSDLSTHLWDEVKSTSLSGKDQERVNSGHQVDVLDFGAVDIFATGKLAEQQPKDLPNGPLAKHQERTNDGDMVDVL